MMNECQVTPVSLDATIDRLVEESQLDRRHENRKREERDNATFGGVCGAKFIEFGSVDQIRNFRLFLKLYENDQIVLCPHRLARLIDHRESGGFWTRQGIGHNYLDSQSFLQGFISGAKRHLQEILNRSEARNVKLDLDEPAQ
jgi:hypothetical protein